MRKKKAQTEMMGLAVIVILLMVGMFFVIKFVVLKQPKTIKKEFTQSLLSSNFLNTLLKTTTDCQINTDLEAVLGACASGKRLLCVDGNLSCDYAHNYINQMLKNTLASPGWGSKSYILGVYLGGNRTGLADECMGAGNYVPIPPTNCLKGKMLYYNRPDLCEVYETETFAIPLYPGALLLTLRICT